MPGTSASSSSSTTRLSASLASTCRILLTEVLKFTQLALDLPVHLEGFLPLSQTPLVPGDDQLAHLLTQRPITAEAGASRSRSEELLDFRLDVQGCPPLGDSPIRAGLDHLADLLLAHLGGDRANRTPGALGKVLLEGELPLADLLQGVTGS